MLPAARVSYRQRLFFSAMLDRPTLALALIPHVRAMFGNQLQVLGEV